MSTGTFSARYMRIWYRDPVLKAVLAVLVGTFIFSFSLLRHVEGTTVPHIGVSLAGVFLGVGLVLFLVFLDRVVHRLRPVKVAALVARAGRAALREAAAAASRPRGDDTDAELARAQRGRTDPRRPEQPTRCDSGDPSERARLLGDRQRLHARAAPYGGRLRLHRRTHAGGVRDSGARTDSTQSGSTG